MSLLCWHTTSPEDYPRRSLGCYFFGLFEDGVYGPMETSLKNKKEEKAGFEKLTSIAHF